MHSAHVTSYIAGSNQSTGNRSWLAIHQLSSSSRLFDDFQVAERASTPILDHVAEAFRMEDAKANVSPLKRVSRACLHCRQRKSKCDLLVTDLCFISITDPQPHGPQALLPADMPQGRVWRLSTMREMPEGWSRLYSRWLESRWQSRQKEEHHQQHLESGISLDPQSSTRTRRDQAVFELAEQRFLTVCATTIISSTADDRSGPRPR